MEYKQGRGASAAAAAAAAAAIAAAAGQPHGLNSGGNASRGWPPLDAEATCSDAACKPASRLRRSHRRAARGRCRAACHRAAHLPRAPWTETVGAHPTGPSASQISAPPPLPALCVGWRRRFPVLLLLLLPDTRPSADGVISWSLELPPPSGRRDP